MTKQILRELNYKYNIHPGTIMRRLPDFEALRLGQSIKSGSKEECILAGHLAWDEFIDMLKETL